MKKLLLLLIATCACLTTAFAQEIVTTGEVQGITKDGTLVVHSDQTKGLVSFQGAANSNIFTVDGSPAQLSDLKTGTKVTVQHASRGGKWYVSKIMFGEVKKPATPDPSTVNQVSILPGNGQNPTGYKEVLNHSGTVAPLTGTKAP